MSEVPISSPYRSTPEAPVTDDERNTVGERVNAAFTSGAIDDDEYRARLDRLYAAQRMGDLLPVVEGLPALPTYANPAIVTERSAAGPGELTPARSGTNLTVITVASLAGALLVVIVLLVVLLR